MKVKHIFFICTGLLAFSLINEIEFNKPEQNFNKDGHYQILQTEKAVSLKAIVDIAIAGQTHSDLIVALENEKNKEIVNKTNPKPIEVKTSLPISSSDVSVLQMNVDEKEVRALITRVNLKGSELKIVSNEDTSDIVVLDNKGDVIFLKDGNKERFAASAVSNIAEIRNVFKTNTPTSSLKKG